MKIAFIASECEPFVKTGGLADVVSSLPKALKELGHEVMIILPYYGAVKRKNINTVTFFDSMGVWMGAGIQEWCSVRKTIAEDEVPVFFIEFDHYFDRSGLYCDEINRDYTDNAARFAFFSRAALQLLKDMDFQPDVVHAHDWQTAPVVAYMKTWGWGKSGIDKAAAVLTIHNIGYQGVYHADAYKYCGFSEWDFVPDIFEDHGRINFLKGGIHYADMVTTVSPTYAKETTIGEQSYGFAPYLNNKGERYKGILNGVDYSSWDPSNDKLIPAKFSADKMEGKHECRKILKQKFGLDDSKDVPVLGVVSRFADQKGLDVFAAAVEKILNTMEIHIAILGSGDKALESYFGWLPSMMPGKAGAVIGYNNEIAHLIEAGSDFFIMPSRYEPCGLNQIYSLRYGTLPIVRNTGGLADTVIQYDERTGDGTGFKFDYLSVDSIFDTVGWAVSTYFDRPQHLKKMRKTAMNQDFSWTKSANEYEGIYDEILTEKRGEK
ncbi:MAG TPA: glycogen synthase GlgA [bacterium]|nr:glycogen synthase GlgA [bacterium]HPM47400.1 glycogen synthase GlgA [bacterium]HRQ69504.1 glycogen synthase GlgA [bacterium]